MENESELDQILRTLTVVRDATLSCRSKGARSPRILLHPIRAFSTGVGVDRQQSIFSSLYLYYSLAVEKIKIA